MLNLSDNELDRLSREAASQHDPGDLTGPQAWERLEVRLDKELGRAGPDISRGVRRGIRRLPFLYAPVILLIVGVSWYFVKQATKGRKEGSSGSPPLTVVKTPQQLGVTTPGSDPSLKKPAYSDNSTSTPYQDQNIKDPAPGSASAPLTTADAPAAAGAHTTPAGTHTAPAETSGNPGSPSPGTASGSFAPSRGSTSGSSAASPGSSLASGSTSSRLANIHPNRSGASTDVTHSRTHTRHHHDLISKTGPGTTPDHSNEVSSSTTLNNPGSKGQSAPGPADPSRSYVQRPRTLRNHPTISDSALRAFTTHTPTDPGKKSGPSLRINRSLTFGLQIAPDFSSVNSLAGDRPGSSIGLTVDYQFVNRLHLGTGLLFSKKNYTARNQDYHVPRNYYQMNGLKDVDFVKGTMSMIEIPINLRYDFSVTGNTIFFATAGVSTYLFGKENSNYYFDSFGREACKEYNYSGQHNFLSAASLSLGVETGISNSISVLVAPYMKLPLDNIGFGKIRMNSVGINVAIRYAPVISRKRQH